MPNYMLLLYNCPDDFQDTSPEEMQQVIQKYRAWGEQLKESGHLLGTDKLKDDEGRVLSRGNGKPRVLDGPYSETKEVIGGYFAVRAGDYDEAVELCQDCPHLEHGGTIEIREIDELHDAVTPT